jgi:hypothetical protein
VIGDCRKSGIWYAVMVKGQSDFTSGCYLQEIKDPERRLRAYDTAKGHMILYQSRFSEWTNFKTIEALAATS